VWFDFIALDQFQPSLISTQSAHYQIKFKGLAEISAGNFAARGLAVKLEAD
jgi:hypothetical protein